MVLFELVIALLLAGAVLTALARRIGAPYPALLALAGVVLALIPPEIPAVALDPELALVLFVAPVLLDAAFDTSLRDLRANWVPVTSLVLVAVGLTIAAVAVVAHALVPTLPWAAAIALGAIVAPPDAVAASAVLRQISPPHRLLVILEGEGLLNDASALLVYRLAVGVALGASLSAKTAVPLLLAGSLGSLALGYALARLYMGLTRHLNDLAIGVVTQFVATFAVWIVADLLGVSPILTMVIYAIVIARHAPARLGAEHRLGSYAVWEVAVFVLNALAFILVGLQLQEIVKSVDGHAWRYLGFDLAVLATVIVVRLLWTTTHHGIVTLKRRLIGAGRGRDTLPNLRHSLVVGWCGMRGLLTLATALALPGGHGGGPPFPERDLLITAAFAVVVGTLVLQGLTLAPLLRFLNLADDGQVGRERDHARAVTVAAALAVLDTSDGPEAAVLRKEYRLMLGDTTGRHPLHPSRFGDLRMRAIAAERAALARLRGDHEIGDDAFHAIEEELDWAEGNARSRARVLARADETAPAREPEAIPR